MPNAKTVPTPTSNNPDNAIPIPSENRMGMINIQPMRFEPMRVQMELLQPQERLNWGMLSSSVNFSRITPFQPQPQMDLIQLNWRMLSSTPFSEHFTNRQNRQYPNPNDELLRFSEDDIDSYIDSDIDSDDGFPGLIDANGMPFEDRVD